MSFIDKPRASPWRKLLFQIHLWTGVGLGLYILVISLTGAALVFREEMTLAAETRIVSAAKGEPLGWDRLKDAAEGAYPGYRVAWFLNREDPREAVEVWLERDGSETIRLFDPLTGDDLGIKGGAVDALNWLADLHFNLLAGRTGRLVNGVGACFLFLMALTGAVIWWPGVNNWRRGLTVKPRSKWKRLNWDLHSAVGFWTLAFVVIWGVSGAYFAFPGPFQSLVGSFAPLKQFEPPVQPSAPAEGVTPASVEALVAAAEAAVPDGVTTWIGLPRHESETTAMVYRPESHDHDAILRTVVLDAHTREVLRVRDFQDLALGDKILRWLGYLHVGNFGGVFVKILWTILGLTPGVMFATGFLMYWNRVLSKRWNRLSRRAPAQNPVLDPGGMTTAGRRQ